MIPWMAFCFWMYLDSVFEAQGALSGDIEGVYIMTLECALSIRPCSPRYIWNLHFKPQLISETERWMLLRACWCFTTPTPLLRIGNTSKSATITPTAITLVITQWGRRSTVERSNTSHFLDHKLRCWGPTKTFTFLKLFLLFCKMQTYIHNCWIWENIVLNNNKLVVISPLHLAGFLDLRCSCLCILICTKPAST